VNEQEVEHDTITKVARFLAKSSLIFLFNAAQWKPVIQKVAQPNGCQMSSRFEFLSPNLSTVTGWRTVVTTVLLAQRNLLNCRSRMRSTFDQLELGLAFRRTKATAWKNLGRFKYTLPSKTWLN